MLDREVASYRPEEVSEGEVVGEMEEEIEWVCSDVDRVYV